MVLIEILSFLAAVAGLVYLFAAIIFFIPLNNSNKKRQQHGQGGKMPLVSVIIATKNEEKFIGRTLRAVRNMDYPRFEVIVVDSSTDRTAKIARKYADKVIIDRSSSGKPHAINMAAKKARGKILFFIDADTIVEKNTLKKLVSDMGSSAAASGVNLPANRKGLVSYVARTELALLSLVNKAISVVAGTAMIAGRNFVIRKSVLKKAGYFQNSLVEDVNLSWRLHNSGHQVALSAAACREQVPENISSYIKQKERWIAGTVIEMARWPFSVPENRKKGKALALPYIILISVSNIVLAAAILLYAATLNPLFAFLAITALLMNIAPSAVYLNRYEALFAVATSVIYGVIVIFVLLLVAAKTAAGRRMEWNKTPKS